MESNVYSTLLFDAAYLMMTLDAMKANELWSSLLDKVKLSWCKYMPEAMELLSVDLSRLTDWKAMDNVTQQVIRHHLVPTLVSLNQPIASAFHAQWQALLLVFEAVACIEMLQESVPVNKLTEMFSIY